MSERKPIHRASCAPDSRYSDSLRIRQSSSPFGVSTRLKYLRIAITGAYICGILISPRLWFGLRRSFPRVPFVNGLPAFLSSADYLLSILLLIALAFSIISKRPSRYLVAVVAVTLLLVLFDQTRLQPWVYQYVVMLASLAWLRPGEANPDNRENSALIIAANQLIVAFLYFWSGTQKLNWTFANEVMPALLESARIHLPAAFLAYLPVTAIGVAACEALIGLTLVIRKTRHTAVVLAVGMHLLVLLILMLARHNTVVWPWNIAMMITVVTLFWRFDLSLARKELWRWQGSNLVSYLPKVVVVICGLAPALSFFGWWDLYLSGALYSGNTPVAVVRISERVGGRLPEVAQQQLFTTTHGELILPFHEWSLNDVNVPPYPAVRVHKRLARQLCGYADDPSEIELIIRERPSLKDGSYLVSRADCQQLSAR